MEYAEYTKTKVLIITNSFSIICQGKKSKFIREIRNFCFVPNLFFVIEESAEFIIAELFSIYIV